VAATPASFAASAAEVDQALAVCPNVPAVFLIWAHTGEPYLARTNQLRKRLLRLLGPRQHAGRMLHLRDIAVRVDYWPFRSRLESSLLLYELARKHFPETYTKLLKLRQPAFVKLLLTNAYPRTVITTRIAGAESIHYGPFRTRAAAEKFEADVLDLFQIRRCQEDLTPSPGHPGCVYGEMNKCLRPCQMVVSDSEYRGEVDRVAAFLRSNGETLVESVKNARDRLSEELEFEQAQRMHKRLEKITAILQARDELACDVTRLNGVAVLNSTEREAVQLRFFDEGRWLQGATLSLKVEEGKPASLDRKLREIAASLARPGRLTLRERQEHIAILAAWYYASWRDGEWVPYENLSALPYRKLVNAVHRVAKSETGWPCGAAVRS
jgi:excinuclease UvrABC nuclease subunit